ncbi:hypothetical protein Scep_006792 [Stephania cephalantha]|uniref:Uncharacterized protein n=1 Tax=Stephania cephalantha TaxID=152367 RepID=A0AAP0KBC9_9MAGN
MLFRSYSSSATALGVIQERLTTKVVPTSPVTISSSVLSEVSKVGSAVMLASSPSSSSSFSIKRAFFPLHSDFL